MNGCGTGSQRSIGNGYGIDSEFVTVAMQQGNNLNQVDRDILVQFQRPHKFFIICAITAAFNNSDVFLHFDPLNYPVNIGSNTITPNGGEHWIPIANTGANAGKCEGRWIRFTKPITRFFLDVDHRGVNAATPYFITIMGTDDIENVIAERQ